MKSGTASSTAEPGLTNAQAPGDEAAFIRSDEATLPANASVLYMGDLNADLPEAEFTTFTAAGQGQALDPANFSASTSISANRPPTCAIAMTINSYPGHPQRHGRNQLRSQFTRILRQQWQRRHARDDRRSFQQRSFVHDRRRRIFSHSIRHSFRPRDRQRSSSQRRGLHLRRAGADIVRADVCGRNGIAGSSQVSGECGDEISNDGARARISTRPAIHLDNAHHCRYKLMRGAMGLFGKRFCEKSQAAKLAGSARATAPPKQDSIRSSCWRRHLVQ